MRAVFKSSVSSHSVAMSRATFQQSSALVYTVGVVLSTLLGLFIAKLFVKRSYFLRLKRQGLVKMHSLGDRIL